MQRPPAPARRIGPQQLHRFLPGAAQRAEQDGGAHPLRIGAEQAAALQHRQHIADAGAAEIAACGLWHDRCHGSLRQVPAGPDLVQRSRRRISARMAIPAGQQCQRRAFVGIAAGQPPDQRCRPPRHRRGGVILQRHGIGEAELRLGGNHLGNAGDAAAVGPFKPHQVRIEGRHVHLVGGRDPAFGRIVPERHQAGIEQPGPAILRPGRHRQQAVPGGAHRHEAAWCPADVAIAAGIEEIERRRSPMVARGEEFAPVPRRPRPGGVEIGGRARPAPGGAQRKAAPRCRVFVQDGAVAAKFQHHLARRLALHLDRLAHAGEQRALGLHHQILLVDGKDGQRPGDILVVAKAHARQRRLASPGDLQLRRVDVGKIAQIGHGMGAVRIIGQDRPSGG